MRDTLSQGDQQKIKLEWRIWFILIFHFLNFSKMRVFLELLWANVWMFWGPKTVQNAPKELFSSEYALVWVREQNRAFILDFWGICHFFPEDGHFSHFSVTLGSCWATFLRSSNSWGHPGTPIWTPRSIVTLTAPNSLPPAQSESHIQIWDSSPWHGSGHRCMGRDVRDVSWRS